MRRVIDRLVLWARRRARRRERDRALQALPGYCPASTGGRNVPQLRGRAVGLTVAVTVALAGLPGVGYGIASWGAHSASEARVEAADRELERASAAYEAARAVELERAWVEPPGDPVEAVEMYVSPEGETARGLQVEMSSAAAAWRAAANEN